MKIQKYLYSILIALSLISSVPLASAQTNGQSSFSPFAIFGNVIQPKSSTWILGSSTTPLSWGYFNNLTVPTQGSGCAQFSATGTLSSNGITCGSGGIATSSILNFFSGTSPISYSTTSSSGTFSLGTVSVSNGGTGATSFSPGGFLYATGTSAFIASSSPTFVSFNTSTTTATSTISGTLATNRLNISNLNANGIMFADANKNASSSSYWQLSQTNKQLYQADCGTDGNQGALYICDLTHSFKPAIKIIKYVNGSAMDLSIAGAQYVVVASGGSGFVNYTNSSTATSLSNNFSTGSIFDNRNDFDNYGTVGVYARGRNLRSSIGSNPDLSIGIDAVAAEGYSTLNKSFAGRFTSESAYTHAIKTVNYSSQASTTDVIFGTQSDGTTKLYQIQKDGGAIFNSASLGTIQADFTIKGDNDSSLFVVDTSADSIGIGTSTPSAKLHIVGNAGTSTPINIASSTGSSLFKINGAGHITIGGSTPTVSSCGSGASVSGNDTAGTVTVGSGVVTSCVITFAVPRDTTPKVVGIAPNSAIAFGVSSKSTTAFTVTFAATLGGGSFDYYIIETN